eukprot:COSAG01_NODE_2361_length_7832_cov_12.919447_4_plen_192_part_00
MITPPRPTSVHRPNAFLSTVENSDPGPFQVESARRGLQEAVDAATAAEAEMATRRQAHAEADQELEAAESQCTTESSDGRAAQLDDVGGSAGASPLHQPTPPARRSVSASEEEEQLAARAVAQAGERAQMAQEEAVAATAAVEEADARLARATEVAQRTVAAADETERAAAAALLGAREPWCQLTLAQRLF